MVVHLVSQRHYAVSTTSDGTSPSEIINQIKVNFSPALADDRGGAGPSPRRRPEGRRTYV